MSSRITSAISPETNRPAAVVLAVDTSSARPGMAIQRGPELLAALVSSRVEPHSRTLFDNLNLLLDQAVLTIDQIDLFAVVTGPGSFTGLRVGISALKGLAAARRRPLCGVDLLELHARALGSAAPVIVLTTAGRGEIYAGLRRPDPAGGFAPPSGDLYGQAAAVIPTLLARLEPSEISHLLITGNAVDPVRPLLAELAREAGQSLSCPFLAAPAPAGWQILPPHGPMVIQLARTAAHLSLNPSNDSGQQPGDTGLPPAHPFYIRPSDAELNRPESLTRR